MTRNFVKMQGAGNDYLYFDCFDAPIENAAELAIKLSRRRFSVGGDGIILIHPSKIADARMQMFNADGSEGKMCGNGIRCVAKYMYDFRKIGKDTLTVETPAGIKTIRLAIENGEAVRATVDMGDISFEPAAVPLLSDRPFIDAPLTVDGAVWRGTALSVGNPHFVIFTDGVAEMELEKIGPSFEHHTVFPESVNTEFAEMVGKDHIRMRVWERGSGETLACGTGATATAAAAVKLGLCAVNSPVRVDLLGGTLTITVTETGRAFMEGPAEVSFCGTVKI